MMQGELPFRIRSLHERHGPVVRVAPNKLSFTDPSAWKDIYQRRNWHRPGPWRGKPPGVSADSFFSADEGNHARLRKAFNPTFNDKAVRSYEPTITEHVDKLMRIIRTEANLSGDGGSARMDMVRWLNFCLFDIIGDVGWGSTFALLNRGDYHPWVTITLGFKALLAARDGLAMIVRIARDNVTTRLRGTAQRSDAFGYALAQGDGSSLARVGLTQAEAEMCSMSYNAAGSEPVTTTLCALSSNLMHHPAAYQELTCEVRANFKSSATITTAAAQKLPFLIAYIKETLRIAPPIPDGMRRQVDPAGATIAGVPVPGGTVVSVSCLAAFQSSNNFTHPHNFHPERWLAEPINLGGLCRTDFPNDRPETYHPFSYGSRSCLGANLAWAEMGLLVSRLLVEFDMQVPEDGNIPVWDNQSIFWVWDKRPLVLELTPRETCTGLIHASAGSTCTG